MVIDYIAYEYPDSWIRDRVEPISAEMIREHLSFNPEGWTPTDSELDALSDELGPINIEHTLNTQSPSKETFSKIVQSHLEKSIPIIPIINIKMLRRGVKAGVHAVVVTGMNDDFIAIHDPSGHPYDLVDREDFISAWDMVTNQFIKIDLGGQQTLGTNNQGGTQI
jgi:hypothetical protein